MIPGDERANISENGLRRKSRQMAMVLGWSQWPQLPSESFPQISSLSTRVTIKHLHTKPGNRGLVIGWDQQMLQWPFFDWGPHQIEEVQIGRQRFAKTWRKHLNQKKKQKHEFDACEMNISGLGTWTSWNCFFWVWKRVEHVNSRPNRPIPMGPIGPSLIILWSHGWNHQADDQNCSKTSQKNDPQLLRWVSQL